MPRCAGGQADGLNAMPQCAGGQAGGLNAMPQCAGGQAGGLTEGHGRNHGLRGRSYFSGYSRVRAAVTFAVRPRVIGARRPAVLTRSKPAAAAWPEVS
jgi:hypothetical protein